VEDVSGQAFRVHADEHVLHAFDLALHEREVLLVREQLAIGDGLELADLRGSRTDTTRSTSFSVRRRYSMRSATVIILMSVRAQYSTRSGRAPSSRRRS
jgi:hypothetical protein